MPDDERVGSDSRRKTADGSRDSDFSGAAYAKRLRGMLSAFDRPKLPIQPRPSALEIPNEFIAKILDGLSLDREQLDSVTACLRGADDYSAVQADILIEVRSRLTEMAGMVRMIAANERANRE